MDIIPSTAEQHQTAPLSNETIVRKISNMEGRVENLLNILAEARRHLESTLKGVKKDTEIPTGLSPYSPVDS